MRKIFLYFAVTGVLITSSIVLAGPSWLGGNITNITSSKAGLSIILDSGLPDNCQGVSYNWMRIKQEDSAMISVALTLWTTGKTSVTVYTDGIVNGKCIINQLDPAG